VNQPVPRQNTRPPSFTYRQIRRAILRRHPAESFLHCDYVALPDLAERFGTPLYVYSAAAIRERLQTFDQAFRNIPHTICYSVKANSNLGILRLLARLGCGFDVVSAGELERVLRVDQRAATKTVFSGVGKTSGEIHAALKAKILLFNVESESELWTLAECAARSKHRATVALRVNPDVPADTHPYISTGLREHKFGIPIREARKLYAQASGSKHLRVAGVSVHIGSQIIDVGPFGAAMERLADLVDQLRTDGHEIEYIDAGGGLGIDYEDQLSQDFSEYVSAYATALLRPIGNLKAHLLLEPGRSIVGPAGILLTRVLYRKANGRKNFLVVDAAMNDMLRPSLYNAYHRIVPIREPSDRSREALDVVGPICESGDFFARNRQLPAAKEGEWLAILDAGAYGMALASNYNSRLRPAEVLVDGKSVKLIRRRERIDDLLRGETVR
jgi:diaminopimelate decarboxylase